jgi:superfamily II DNA or RNA helicase
VDCNTDKIKRANYITKFKLDCDISLMLNIQILNKGIDIPICDSVFITEPNNNIDNLIQMMSRANRIYLSKIKIVNNNKPIEIKYQKSKNRLTDSYIDKQMENDIDSNIDSDKDLIKQSFDKIKLI